MLIVTPAFGSMPEPRPQQLITGDRAVQLLDAASSAALQAAGVKVATVSLNTYNSLISDLTPEDFAGLDPTTGKLTPDVMPDYVSETAVANLNVFDASHHIDPQYMPSYATPGGLANLIATSSTVQFADDPDGTPVILGLQPTSPQDQTYTGTVTASTHTAGTVHGDLITGTLGQIQTVESSMTIYDNQATQPGAPATGQAKLYADPNSRLRVIDPNGTLFIIGNKRIVPALPTVTDSQLYDQVIISGTGQRFIYLGGSVGSGGWVQDGPLSVNAIADRNNLIGLYPGLRVHVISSGQDHVYRSDNQWHGTQPTFVAGAAPQNVNGINDTNFHTWNLTNFADPGYPYRITGRIDLEVAVLNVVNQIRAEVWVSLGDYGTGANPHTFEISYSDYAQFRRFAMAPMTNTTITGAKSVIITWRCTQNNANAYSGNYQAYNDWMMVPV